MSKQKIVFIVNPNSGTDRTKQSFLSRLDIFKTNSPFEVILEYTTAPRHAQELVKTHLAAGVSQFVAVGGDGTVNEVASQLIQKEATLYIIPKGSGNGLARHLGIPLQEEAALQCILNGKTENIDCGLVNNIPFLCTAGIGFDAYTASLFATSHKRGLFSYLQTGVKGFLQYKPLELTFQGSETRVFSLTFANANQFGNKAYIAPRAIINDGFLDCCLIKPHSKWRSPGLMLRLFSGTIDQSQLAETYRSKHFTLETNEPAAIHYDGEPLQLKEKTIRISIIEKALTVGI